MKHGDDGDTNCGWCAQDNPLSICKEAGGNKKTNRDHPDYSIIKIGQNTEKSPGDLRRLTNARCHSNSGKQKLLANAGGKNSLKS